MAIITPEARRFQIIQNDLNLTAREMGKLLGVSHTTVTRTSKGEREMGYTMIRACVIKLGYSPHWLLLGTGNKKLKGDEAKLVTEVQMLRAEINVTATLNLRLQARLTGMEQEHEELKKAIEELKKEVKK